MATRKPFYGWTIAGMGALGNALQGGIIFWSMGLYTSTFEDEFGAPRAQITLIESFLSVGANVFSPLVGYFCDRWSARAMAAIGALSLGLGLIAASFAGTMLTVWAAFLILIPLGALGLGVLPSSKLISRWFRKRRGLALGISVSGSSIGGAIAPIVVAGLFATLGWRGALFWMGSFMIAMAPLFYLLQADRPEDKGLAQEEEGDAAGAELTMIDQADWTYRQILTERQFWLQTIISAMLLAVTLGTLANLSLHSKDMGLSTGETARLYSILALCSFLGKIAVGWLFDRLGMKRTGLIVAALIFSGMLALSQSTTITAMSAACLVLGTGFGGVTPIWANMIARGFGAQSYGRAMGIMNPLHTPITALSAPFAGYIHDVTRSYDLVFALYLTFISIAAVAMTQLRPPTHPGLPVEQALDREG